jgi:hypothetical protein
MTQTPTDELEDRLAELLSAALEPAGAWARERTPVARPGRRPWWGLGAVAACAAVVAGGLGVRAALRDDASDADAPVVIADEPATTEPEPTTEPVPTTTADDPEPAPPAPTPGVAATAAAGDRTALTGHGEGFVAIVTHADGTSVVRTSPDGTTWSEHAIDLGGTVDHLVSDGSTLTAVGIQGEWGHDRLPSAWQSTDGGATWTGGPMPLPDLPLIDDSLLSIGNTAVAAGDAGVLVTAVAYRWLDLFALVERQTGAPFPEGARLDADGTTITVTPLDGEPFTVDASGVDPSVAVLTDPVEIGVTWVWRPDGTWEVALDPFASLVDTPTGPAGFPGTLALPYGATWGPAGYLVWTPGHLWSSTDGMGWEAAAVPDGMLNQPLLASDGERYLAVLDEGQVMASTDLRTWERVADIADDPATIWGGSGQLVGGRGGFLALRWTYPQVAPEERSPVVVERDGRRLTFDRGAGVVSVVDVATGAELLRWEGDLDAMPPELFAPLDADARFLDPATGAVAFAISIDDLAAAMRAQDQVDRDALPPPTFQVLASADGTTWQPAAVQDDTVGASLAVSDTATAVVPAAPPPAG